MSEVTTNNKEKLYDVAKQYFDQGDLDKALKILNEIIEVGDNDKTESEAYFIIANVFHMRGQLGKAIKAFKKVIAINPDHTDASISLSILFNDIGKYEEGKALFEKTNEKVRGRSAVTVEDPQINNRFSLKHHELAEMYMSYGRYDEALFEINKAIALNGENLELRLKSAKIYSKKGFTSKAFDELKRLKNERPEYLPARLALGVVYYGNGSVIEAQNEWKKILTKDPFNEEALMYLNISDSATETSL